MKYIPPSGFFSYRHLGDNDTTYIKTFHTRLEQEIETQTGHKIALWLDTDEIKWGQHWKNAIEKGLSEAAFFIPVITPGYLLSEPCRKEFLDFVAYEKRLKRKDLIMPLVYVRPEQLDDTNARKVDEIVRLILERQYVDWEPLRCYGDERPEYRQKIIELGKRVRELLKIGGPATLSGATKAKPKNVRKSANKIIRLTAAMKGAKPVASDTSSTVMKRRTLLVNRMGGQGVYQSVTSALRDAIGGDLIRVAPGHYRETIVLDKPVEIIGEGNPGDVTVEMKEANVLIASATFGRVRNLTIHQGGGDFYAVYIKAGSVELEACEVTSAGISCIGVEGDADAFVRKCKVHGSHQGGIVFFDKARGVVEACDIYGNGVLGIQTVGCMEVTVRGNRIYKNGTGVLFANSSGVLMEDNEVFGSRLSGIEIKEKANPTIRLNRIYDNEGGGILIRSASCGVIRENEIFGNYFSAIEVGEKSKPTIKGNQIHNGKTSGIFVHTDSEAMIENNIIRKNHSHGIMVQEGGRVEARNNVIEQNSFYGIRIIAKSGGTFEKNQLSGNKKGSKEIAPEAQPLVTWKDDDQKT